VFNSAGTHHTIIPLKLSCCNHTKSNCLISLETQLKTTQKVLFLVYSRLPDKGQTWLLSDLCAASLQGKMSENCFVQFNSGADRDMQNKFESF